MKHVKFNVGILAYISNSEVQIISSNYRITRQTAVYMRALLLRYVYILRGELL